MKKNFRNEKASVTVEATLIIIIFISAYIILLGVINVYRAYSLVQNTVNQSAKQIAEYCYIMHKAGLSDIGSNTSEEADAFSEETKKTIDTVMVFFNATSEGYDKAKSTAQKVGQLGNDYPADLITDMQEAGQDIQSVYTKGKAAIEASKNYFKDPKVLFNGILAVMKDAAFDTSKLLIATPISSSVASGYLDAYSDEKIKSLGIVGGKSGINFWGSSIFLDMQSVEVCANYRVRLEAPFFDKFELKMRNTAVTRAWIGDGSFRHANYKINNRSKKTSGSRLSHKALEKPNSQKESNDFDMKELNIDGSVWDKPAMERGSIIQNTEGTEVTNNVGKNFNTVNVWNKEEKYIANVRSCNPEDKTYASKNHFYNTLKKDIDDIAKFTEHSQGGVTITTSDYTEKRYFLVFPKKDLGEEHKQVLLKLQDYAKEKGVKIQYFTTKERK